jgi:predicted metallopeptidase
VLKYINYRKKKKNSPVIWEKAPDIEKKTRLIFKAIGFDKNNSKNIYYFRSKNSRANARARIWGLTRIWQLSLNIPPSYIIEVISENFDHLSESQKEEVLIHEIAHIPKNFSGSLVPHFRRGSRKFSKKVDLILGSYLKNLK